MNGGQEPLDAEEWRETFQAARGRFILGEIDEDEYRRKLRELGFNAREIDDEVRIAGS